MQEPQKLTELKEKLQQATDAQAKAVAKRVEAFLDGCESPCRVGVFASPDETWSYVSVLIRKEKGAAGVPIVESLFHEILPGDSKRPNHIQGAIDGVLVDLHYNIAWGRPASASETEESAVNPLQTVSLL